MPTKQIPLYGEFTSKYHTAFSDFNNTYPSDPYYLNGFFSVQQGVQEDIRKMAFCKRPGTDLASDALTNLSGLTNGWKVQGMVSSFDKTKLIFFANSGAANKSYFYDGATLTDKGAPAGGWTNSGAVVFTMLDGISYSATGFYAATDFTKGAIINSTGDWTQITDVDFTGLTKVTNFCAMDGYLFIGTDNNRIYNSNLNAPTNWVSTSFLTAADTPGKIMWLMRCRNYLVAFKQHSMEFFEDTGNPTPGSPLTAQKQLNRKVGLASKSSVKEVSDGIIFLGISEHGKLDMYKLKKDDLSLEIISNNYIDEVLGNFTKVDAAYSVDPTSGTNAGEAQIINFMGKEFYLICLNDGSNKTFVYDNDLKTWMRWATCLTAANVLDSNFTPMQSTLFISGGVLYNVLAQNFLSDGTHPPFFVTINNSGSFFADVSSSGGGYSGFPLMWVSDVMDFGTRKRKFMDSLEVLYDSYVYSSSAGTSPGNSIIVAYRDADFNVESPNRVVSRTLTYSPGMRTRLISRQLGSFRRRSFILYQTDTLNSYPFRIWGIEVQFNFGETDQEG